MTLHIPEKDFFDKLLSLFGKKRAVFIPKEGMNQKFGVYKCKKGSLIRALLRPKGANPPNGWMYLDDVGK